MAQPRCRLASRGVTEKAMRAYLRKHGADVPDYRGKSPASLAAATARRGQAVKEKQPCSEDGCDRDAIARGMCRMHYRHWHAENGPPCAIEGCGRGVVGRGLCTTHYAANRATRQKERS